MKEHGRAQVRARWRGGRHRGLKARLFFWFLGTIVIAVVSATVATQVFEPEQEPAGATISRNVQFRLSRQWNDRAATDAYVAELRENTGVDLQIERDPTKVPKHAHRGPRGARGIVFDGSRGYLPIQQDGVVVGALTFPVGGPRHRLLTVSLALVVFVGVLAAAARRVAGRLSLPLEEVAQTAERFGKGELSARTNMAAYVGRGALADEVRALGIAFDDMASRIERTVQGQRELLGAISHELRSPLGRAKVALEIAKESSDPSFTVLERELDAVDAILGDLLFAARAGLTDLRREPVEVASWLSATFEGDDVRIEVTERALGRHALLDRGLFARAITNLVQNARNHGDAAIGPVTISLDRQGDTLVIAVSDRGPGFAEDVLPHAFEPFVRGSVARTPEASRSTGLGLTLVKRIVEAHGGTVAASNVTVDHAVRGARVELVLPIRGADASS